MSTEHRLNNTYRGKLKYGKRNPSIFTLFITNPTRASLGLNLGFCSERLVNNHPSSGTMWLDMALSIRDNTAWC
jgi:hypothetical protein